MSTVFVLYHLNLSIQLRLHFTLVPLIFVSFCKRKMDVISFFAFVPLTLVKWIGSFWKPALFVFIVAGTIGTSGGMSACVIWCGLGLDGTMFMWSSFNWDLVTFWWPSSLPYSRLMWTVILTKWTRTARFWLLFTVKQCALVFYLAVPNLTGICWVSMMWQFFNKPPTW
jgi:hypothetical protein